MRTLFKAILATVGLAAPLYANAIPITWEFNGKCTGGDCTEVPSVHGTLTGDPAASNWDSDGNLTALILIDEVTSYDFMIGDGSDFHFVGNNAFGQYAVNAAGDIVGGHMSFGGLFLNLTLGDVHGATTAEWSFDCSFLVCRGGLGASGSGSYTRVTAVPEPATLSLLGLGLLAFGLVRRRRV